MGALEFGRFEAYLVYKLKHHGILVSEAYTHQTRPHGSQLNKVAGHTYRCCACGYRAHRDGDVAVNILNKGRRQRDILPGTILVPERITYGRPVALKRVLRRSSGEPRHVADGISGGESVSRPAMQRARVP